MIIVAGHLIVDASQRDAYVADCVRVVTKARAAPGCLDFAIAADTLVAGRVNIFERWETQAAVEAFRGDGPSENQSAKIHSGSVAEYDIQATRILIDK
jgi:quinol monooxygenase YgiN